MRRENGESSIRNVLHVSVYTECSTLFKMSFLPGEIKSRGMIKFKSKMNTRIFIG